MGLKPHLNQVSIYKDKCYAPRIFVHTNYSNGYSLRGSKCYGFVTGKVGIPGQLNMMVDLRDLFLV